MIEPKNAFALPPKLFNFDLSFQAYEEVFGISRFLYVEDMGAVRPGGGDFYMMPNLVDSIIIALGSTGLAMMISILEKVLLILMLTEVLVFYLNKPVPGDIFNKVKMEY